MTNLAETHGGQVKALSDIGVGTLAPRGTLLVFYDSSGLHNTAGHSCVMKTSHYIVGYNQEGWFTGRASIMGSPCIARVKFVGLVVVT